MVSTDIDVTSWTLVRNHAGKAIYKKELGNSNGLVVSKVYIPAKTCLKGMSETSFGLYGLTGNGNIDLGYFGKDSFIWCQTPSVTDDHMARTNVEAIMVEFDADSTTQTSSTDLLPCSVLPLPSGGYVKNLCSMSGNGDTVVVRELLLPHGVPYQEENEKKFSGIYVMSGVANTKCGYQGPDSYFQAEHEAMELQATGEVYAKLISVTMA